MQNFGQNPQRISILQELTEANAELGEAFALVMDDMVTQTGIPNPDAEEFDIMSESWRKLADKPDKTPEENQKLDNSLKNEVKAYAHSYLLYICKETKNTTGKLESSQYESYMIKHRFSKYGFATMKPEYLNMIKEQIKNAFIKIASHGDMNNPDNIIDKNDMECFIYALLILSRKNNNGEFVGFKINGKLSPQNYAVNEHFLFEAGENFFSEKLNLAYKILNNLI